MICWGEGGATSQGKPGKKRQAVDKADVNGLKAIANRPEEANFVSTKVGMKVMLVIAGCFCFSAKAHCQAEGKPS